ncbi:MAG: nuclear transport factor 2 family protein [Nitrospirae bacterium]|nr:nuclear transport factor 2 family protein [Nitrospirota bacterium]
MPVLFAVIASASVALGADANVGKDKAALSKLDMKRRVPARMIQQKTSVSRTKRVESEIDIMLKAFSKAYVDRDLIDVMSYYSTDQDTIAVGSNEDEKFIGPEMIKEGYLQDFLAAKQLKYFDVKVLALSSYGNVAWLFADANVGIVTKQKTIDVKGRFTAVLKRGGSGWKFVQTHFSLPAPTPGDNVCNTIKLSD